MTTFAAVGRGHEGVRQFMAELERQSADWNRTFAPSVAALGTQHAAAP